MSDCETLSFEDWCAKIDAELRDMLGLGRDDLPDMLYWQSWNDGESVDGMLIQICEENDLDPTEFGLEY